ncbi:hypothetical protein ACFL2R_03090 [Patescibacteria group bacterium]
MSGNIREILEILWGCCMLFNLIFHIRAVLKNEEWLLFWFTPIITLSGPIGTRIIIWVMRSEK